MMPVRRSNQTWLPSIFNDFFDNDWMVKANATAPAINVIESDKDYKVEVAAPGMTKEDFKIHINEDNDLVISMEKKTESTEGDKEGKKESLCLPRHGRGVKLLVGIAIPHQIHVDGVPHNGVARPQSLIRPDGHILISAGADAHYNYLNQCAPPNALPQRRRSRRPALFFVRSVFRHPAAPPARRHCPRR